MKKRREARDGQNTGIKRKKPKNNPKRNKKCRG